MSIVPIAPVVFGILVMWGLVEGLASLADWRLRRQRRRRKRSAS